MQGSNISLSTLELMDSPDDSPGKDRSWVTLHFSTKLPDELIPICSVTPRGDSSNPGICFASSFRINKFQPLLISLLRASAKNS